MRLARTARWALPFVMVGLLALVLGTGHGTPLRATSSPVPTRSQEKTTAQALPAGLAPVLSGTLATEDAAYGIAPEPQSGAGFRAANPAQRLSAAFRADGLSVTGDDAAGNTGIRLRALGYGAALVPVMNAAPLLSSGRVEYHRGNVTEWYLNSPLGIEQGFTLAAPPMGTRVGDLVLALDVAGATIADDGEGGLVFALPDGGRLRYGQLTVTDATGRMLPSQLIADGTSIRIAVNDVGATYPLVVDPLVQTTKLTATGEIGAASFGHAVAMSADGNTALIGAYGDNGTTGAAWVFIRSGATWSQQQKLIGTGTVGQAAFGVKVALSADGNTALIGAETDNNFVGAAFVFTRSGTTWTQQGSKLTANDEVGQSRLGIAVALSADGNTALTGAYADNGGVGAAWVFTRSGGVWSQQGPRLTATGTIGGAAVGFSVALSSDGNTALIGAFEDDNANLIGAAFVFVRSGGIWAQQQKLTANDSVGPDREFGFRVALSADGNTALIGGYTDNTNTGAAWVFTRSGTIWTQQGSKLTASGAVGQAQFGTDVALSSDGNTALIGAYKDSSGVGAAFTFTRNGTTWNQQGSKLTGSGEVGNAFFGWAVALSADGNTALIGAYQDNGTIGAAFAFARAIAVTAVVGTTPQSATVSSPFATPLGAHVTDASDGTPLSGVPVTFTAPAAGASGTFTGGGTTATVNTDASGNATAPAFTANSTAGSYAVSVTAAGQTSGLFQLTNLPGSAARIVTNGGTPQSATIGAAFANPLSVIVQDLDGNGVPDVLVTYAAPASGASGTLSGSASITTNSNGVATPLGFTANTVAGSYSVTAAAAGVAAPATFALTNRPGAALHLAANGGTTPQSATVGAAFPNPLAVTVTDASGNGVPGVSVTFHTPASGARGTFPGGGTTATVASNSSGVASVAVTANTTAGGYSITADSGAVADVATFNLTNVAGGVANVTANAGTTPQSATVGAAFTNPLAVTVKDGNGNALNGVAVTFTAPATGPSGTFANSTATTATTTNGSGVATATAFTANSVQGSYLVTATVGGGALVTFNLSNLAGSPSSIVATLGSGQSATIGASFPVALQATLRDANGNLVSGATVTFAAPASGPGGSFGGSATVTTNGNGIATAPAFTANAISGAYTVTASAAGVATPALFNLSNTPGIVASFTVAGIPSSVVASSVHPFTVTAKDGGGNTITGYIGTVHFTSSDSAATLPANYTFNAADAGAHTFNATLMTVGAGRSITATDTVAGSTGTEGGITVIPAVTAVTPLNGPASGGTTVTVIGVGLTGATGVSFGGSACNVGSIDATGTSLTCTTTAHAAGTIDVSVTTPNGTGTLSHGFTFLPTAIAPNPGGRSGGGGGGGGGSPPAVPTSR